MRVESLKATSLIFAGKSPTKATSTSTSAPQEEQEEQAEGEAVEEGAEDDVRFNLLSPLFNFNYNLLIKPNPKPQNCVTK